MLATILSFRLHSFCMICAFGQPFNCKASGGFLHVPAHGALVGGLHVVTLHVGRAVDVAQVVGAFVGIEDERATVVGEKVSGARVVVVEEQVFGVGELHRDGVIVRVAGLYVAGDEDEFLLLT